jgi:hypothetical protein
VPADTQWDGRGGDWMLRKRQWKRLGIKSEEGRGKALTFKTPKYFSDGRVANTMAGTSIFDPVICELVYRKWCPDGGQIIDPFAGGSVRGIVASVLGKKYWGCELRAEQVKANRKQLAATNTGKYKPTWVQGDSFEQLPKAPKAKLMFSCPPYGDLERYSDNPKDISNLGSYEKFLARYKAIIKRGVKRISAGGYACFVVGNFRDKKTGGMHDFQGDTIRAFTEAGMHYMEEIVHVLPMGKAPTRVWRTFERGHGKLTMLHQYVLVFKKP